MKHLYKTLLATAILSLAAMEALATEPADALAGQVLDADGKPAPKATVWLIGGLPFDGDTKALEKIETDDQGRFVFPDAKSKHGQSQRWIREPELLARGAQGQLGWGSDIWIYPQKNPRQDIRVKLAAVQEYRGRLVDASGRPIAKAHILPKYLVYEVPARIHNKIADLLPELAEHYSCDTGDDGEFTIKQMPADMGIAAEIAAPGFGVIRARWSLVKPVALRLEKPGIIRGSMAAPSSSGSLAGIKIYFHTASKPTSEKEPEFTISPRKDETSTDKDGVFQFDAVPPGKYVIEPSLYESSLPFTTKSKVDLEVKSDEVTNVSVQLQPAIEVRGQVVDAETGKGVPGVKLDVCMVDDNRIRHSARRVTTDAEGKYIVFVDPGKIMVVVEELPDVYLNPSSQNDLPIVEVKQAATYPTIKLQRGVQLEGLVVDESGKPVPDAEVQALLGNISRDMVYERTDQSGRFSIKGIDTNKILAIRARSSAGVSEIKEVRPADVQPLLRIDLSPKTAFMLRGTCVDPAGGPIGGSKIKINTSWMLGSYGPGFNAASGVTDAEGRFEFGNLWPGCNYQVSVEAEGFAKYESKQIKSQAGATEDIGKLALIEQKGSVAGTVIDSAGKPLAAARVFNTGDAPKTINTTSDPAGRFRLDGLRSGGIFVFAKKDGYRLKAVATDSNAAGLTITLLRSDEPIPAWKPARQPAAYAEELEAAGKILEKLHSLPEKSSYPWTYRFMARIDPARALEWTKNAKGLYKSEPCRLAAEKIAETDVDEALALIAPYGDYRSFMTLQSLAERYAASDPVKAERLVAEAILLARKFDQPERTYALSEAGSTVVRLGKTEQGRKLIEEAAAMAEKMATSDRSVYLRGLVAADLAPFNLSKAIALVEPTDAGSEKNRALARIAKVIAPQNLEKALEMLNKLNEQSNLPDNTRLAIAYQLAPTRLKDALRVADSMETFAAAKTKAEAYGWLALAVGQKDRKTAWSLIDKSILLYEEKAQELRGWSSSGGRGGYAAHVVIHANAIGYPDMGTLIDRVLAMRPSAEDDPSPRSLQKPVVTMAKLLALVDPQTAKRLLESIAPRIDQY
ncbi:MAG: carboxypeptidase regulatory-like domain-containing protein, partial [Thermoguttaceae bacterium]